MGYWRVEAPFYWVNLGRRLVGFIYDAGCWLVFYNDTNL